MKHEFRFPDIGEGIHEGTLTKWLVKKGEKITEGDSVAEVETDKVTTEIPSSKSGTVSELNFEEGDTINVGDVFIVIDTEGGSSDEVEDNASKKVAMPRVDEADKKQELDEKEEVIEEETAGVVGEVVASSDEIPSSNEAESSSNDKNTQKKGKILATPVARKLAKDLGVDIQDVDGSGPQGRVMQEDIRDALEKMDKPKKFEKVKRLEEYGDESSEKSKPQDTSSREERIPLSRIRQTIAEKMSESRFTIPHTTAMDEIDVTDLYEFRKKYKDKLGADVSLTFLPFIIKAVIRGLKEHPEFNSSFDEERKELVLKHYYHIGIATDTDRGLMVPVLEDADKLSIIDISKGIEDISERARENKLDISELRGSTFTVTNYGSIGGMFGIPIINYPESAILGIGRIQEKPAVVDGRIVIRRMLPLSLSYDHRIIDGASGAKLLNILKDLLMNPEMLLLKS